MNNNQTEQHDEICINPGSAYGKHRVARRVWNDLCKKYGFPADSLPEYISSGAEQTTYSFGDKYVLKVSDRDFIIKTGKKLKGKRIPMVAKCLTIVKANDRPNDSLHCMVQERCRAMNGEGDTNNFHKLAKLVQEFKNKDVPPDLLIAAAQLTKLNVDYLCDLHSANMMFDPKNTAVLSDYGCLRF